MIHATMNISAENGSGLPNIAGSEDHQITLFAKVMASLQLIMMVAIQTGNTLVIIATIKFSALRNATGLFVCNLAIADLIMGFVLPFQVMFWFQPGLVKNDYACLFRFLLVSFSVRASIYSLACTVVDRYVAIAYPLRYTEVMTFKLACILLTVVWLVSISISMIPIVGFEYFVTVRICVLPLILHDGLRFFENTSNILFGAFMAALYARIYMIVRRHAREIAASESIQTAPNDVRKSRNMNTVVALVVIVFHISWLPFFCAQMTMIRKRDVTPTKVQVSSFLILE